MPPTDVYIFVSKAVGERHVEKSQFMSSTVACSLHFDRNRNFFFTLFGVTSK